ncbi:MAG: family protein phosphatase [Clostridia bacterium]|nr:family protein phosphatase [Clostridia bacterium]
MRAEGLSHLGLVRTDNEDSYLIDLDFGLIAIADGMGGHQAGEVASQLALMAFFDYLRRHSSDGDPLAVIKAAVSHANTVVYRASLAHASRAGMGTTLTAAWLAREKLFLAHVGDSRAYLLQDQKLIQLTVDHTYVNELVLNGNLTPEEARRHPRRNILTRALGTETEVEIDCLEVACSPADIVLLCTDGLYEVTTEAEIASIIGHIQDLRLAASMLVNLALARGGTDNITVVLAAYA